MDGEAEHCVECKEKPAEQLVELYDTIHIDGNICPEEWEKIYQD